MEKPAITDYPIHDLIARRWSPRSFDARPLSDEQVRTLLEAARWAPSCFNEQPWRYLVAGREQKDAFDTMLGCLAEMNQQWAKNAAVLMISVAATQFARNGKPNRHAFHDVGLASAQLTLQATAMDLAVHQMAGFDRDRARQVYAIPDEYEPVAALAIGYPGEPAALPETFRERELAKRSRKSPAQIAYADTWGESL
ncbi:MAG: nitroreductase family protein [Proteobacteria bacterium]|nr:nitroreductase family protein [Pseudomonadota bacterium]